MHLGTYRSSNSGSFYAGGGGGGGGASCTGGGCSPCGTGGYGGTNDGNGSNPARNAPGPTPDSSARAGTTNRLVVAVVVLMVNPTSGANGGSGIVVIRYKFQ